MEVYFSLGSNLGNKSDKLKEALARMDEAFGKSFSRLSSFIETEPWGFDSENSFVNAAVMYELSLDPHEILRICKKIESDMGREQKVIYDANGRRIYSSRIIDIDILLCGDLKIDTENLKIPHPLMYERDFVMIPLNEIISNNK